VKDLGARVGVAAVGIPALLFLLYAGGWVLGVPLALIAALGAGEVFRFAECRGVRPLRWLGMLSAASVVVAAVLRPGFTELAPWVLGGLALLIPLALAAALWVRGTDRAPLASVSVTVFGALYAGLPLAFLVLLHALPGRFGWGTLRPSAWAGLLAVLLPLAATMVGDAVAYFAGSAWGRRKLFPSVSPAKSWVGAVTGVMGAAVGGVAWLAIARASLPGLPVEGFGTAAALGAALGVGAIVGDLGESMLKREAGLKDSGRLFPGHGGVLDRLDALVYTIPMAYALLRLLEMTA
jgi:phosphatidate cytidylyltransferase